MTNGEATREQETALDFTLQAFMAGGGVERRG